MPALVAASAASSCPAETPCRRVASRADALVPVSYPQLIVSASGSHRVPKFLRERKLRAIAFAASLRGLTRHRLMVDNSASWCDEPWDLRCGCAGLFPQFSSHTDSVRCHLQSVS